MADMAIKKAPRKYQTDALAAMADALVRKATTKRGIVVLPTGAGKTYVASYFNTQLIKQLDMRIIWVAHREELIKQAIASHADLHDGCKVTEWSSRKKDATGQIIFTSIQSSKGLAETLEALGFARQEKYALVIDEAHHFASQDEKGYSNMYAKLEKTLFDLGIIRFSYGLTATATRLDGRPLGYDNIIYQMRFIEGVKEGFLAKPLYYEMRTKQQFHLDTGLSKEGKRDYTDADLRQLDNEKRNIGIVEEYLRHHEFRTNEDGSTKLDEGGNPVPGWGKTLLFAINIQHCYNLAEELKKRKPDLDLRVVTGGTSDAERKDFAEWLASGDVNTPKVAINCLVFTEGFDEPTIKTVFLTRPTKSEALWMQMVGRGARIVKDADGKTIKDTFNLVSVMDEIGRYGALVKEWTLGLLDDTQEEVKKAKAKRTQSVKAKRFLVSKVFEEQHIDQPEMSEAELVDVQAILVASTKVSTPIGVPMDRDRIDCIRMLRDYIQLCFVEKMMGDGSKSVEIDMDAFRNSYSHCVQANEFDHATWRQISWAYYFRFIRKQNFVRNTITGKNEPTWKLISMVDNEEIDGQSAVIEAENRIKEVKENAHHKNEEFNLQYGSGAGKQRLYEQILNTISTRGGPANALFCSENAVRILSKDRRMEVKLKYQVTGERDPSLKIIGTLNKIGSEVMQSLLGDSVCEFRVSPATGVG